MLAQYMRLDQSIQSLVDSGEYHELYGPPSCPREFRGIDKARIELVLEAIAQNKCNIVDCVFALLDTRKSWFNKATSGTLFRDGATTAMIGCHIGILQRNEGKQDREGRDYWIKPLTTIGAIEHVHFLSETGGFIRGHPIPKSGNSAYRLNSEFIEILEASDDEWEIFLIEWASASSKRRRAMIQSEAVAKSRSLVDTKHADLIQASIEIYAKNFLKEYECLYVDDADGDRITKDEEKRLLDAGICILLDDAIPDALFWNRETEMIWVIEAVISDGEIDYQKMEKLCKLGIRNKKKGIGFTTCYLDWKTAAKRQSKMKNIAPNSYIWILEDGEKQFHVESCVEDIGRMR